MDIRLVELAVWANGPTVDGGTHSQILNYLDPEELCEYFARTQPGTALHECMKVSVGVFKNNRLREAEEEAALLAKAQHDLYPVQPEDADNYPREQHDTFYVRFEMDAEYDNRADGVYDL
jgi:hypothetical protein